MLAKLGIPVTCSDLFGNWGRRGWTGCGCPSRTSASSPRCGSSLAGWLTTEIGLLDAVIADLLGSYQPYHALRGLPGLRPVLAQWPSPRSII